MLWAYALVSAIKSPAVVNRIEPISTTTPNPSFVFTTENITANVTETNVSIKVFLLRISLFRTPKSKKDPRQGGRDSEAIITSEPNGNV